MEAETVKRLFTLVAFATCLSGATAQAAHVQWKGTFCITAEAGTCFWNAGCYPMRYHPPNLGDNGPPTNLSVFSAGQGGGLGGQTDNYVLQSGNLIGSTFKAVDGSGIGRGAYTFSAKMRITKQTPKVLTETTTYVTLAGSIKGFDNSSTCNVDFIAQGIVQSY
jgi:hypothetical protein